MVKKKAIFLIERHIVTESPESLEKTSTFGRGNFNLRNLRAFRQRRFGPFPGKEEAFSYLGSHYRFDLLGLTRWKKNGNCLIGQQEDLIWGIHPSKIEYLLQYSPSGVIRPVTNLDEVIKKYYPYGPDL